MTIRKPGGDMMYSVYLVDGNAQTLGDLINEIPWNENGFRVVGSSLAPALAVGEIAALSPHVVVFDRDSIQMDSRQLMSEIHAAHAACKIVILTAFYTVNAMRNFFGRGGYDYLLKPLSKQDSAAYLQELRARLDKSSRPALPKNWRGR